MNCFLHIALSSNERYMPGAMVAAAGVAVSAKPETLLHFHIFTEEVKDETFKFFAETLKRIHENTEVSRHECGKKMLDGLPYWAGSRMAAVRCHYATLMPDVDWCLYLDCDVLYLASVEEHFSYKDDAVYACVVQEESVKTRNSERRWICEHCGINICDEKYFNSGVVLFNLKKMRDDDVPERLMQFFKNHPDVPSPDQDALNTVFVGCVKLLPAKFDRLQVYLDDNKLLERPVIHYVKGNPWLPKYGEVASWRFRLWHFFADKYIWKCNGESYRRLFTKKLLLGKYICYCLLKIPLVCRMFSYVLFMLKQISDPVVWRNDQVGYDCSRKSIRRVLGSLR